MATVSIKKMNCLHCVASTKTAPEELDRTSNVHINLNKNEANYDGNVDVATGKKTISKIGFEAILSND